MISPVQSVECEYLMHGTDCVHAKSTNVISHGKYEVIYIEVEMNCIYAACCTETQDSIIFTFHNRTGSY